MSKYHVVLGSHVVKSVARQRHASLWKEGSTCRGSFGAATAICTDIKTEPFEGGPSKTQSSLQLMSSKDSSHVLPSYVDTFCRAEQQKSKKMLSVLYAEKEKKNGG